MIVVVDDRNLVTEGYQALFGREGFCCIGFAGQEFRNWASGASREELSSVKAVLISDNAADAMSQEVRNRLPLAPRLALIDQPNLDTTLRLFEAGFDDVVRKPVHVKELLARIHVVKQRNNPAEGLEAQPGLRVFLDGRDPEIDGIPLKLPRREQRILEYLASVEGRRVTRSQIFTATYGIMEEEVEECVVESHISKLRKKLRERLGDDPIDSKRFLGYRLVLADASIDDDDDVHAPAMAGAAVMAQRPRASLPA